MTTTPKNWVRQTALFLSSQTITLFGSSIVQFAISWHITLTLKSGLMITLATLCGFLPQAVISLFAGVWADRYDRKKLIIMADAAIASCTAVLAVLFMLGYQELWLLLFISAVRSIGAGIQMPAVSAFLPEIVPEEKLMRVNGINASVQGVLFLLSPAVAGALYKYISFTSVFWVDVVTAVIGIGVLMLVVAPPRVLAPVEPGHMMADMKSGLRYIAHTKWLWQMILFYLFVAMMFGPVVFLTPLMVARSFGTDPQLLVIHEMVFSVGSILGGVLVSVWGGFKNKTHTLIAACAFFGLTTFVMGFSQTFVFYLIIMFLMGISMPFEGSVANTILQTRTAPEMMGRVFGINSIIGSAAMPLSMVFFGPLADVTSVEILLIITGAAITAICLLSLRAKEMVQAGEPLPPGGEAQGEEPLPAASAETTD